MVYSTIYPVVRGKDKNGPSRYMEENEKQYDIMVEVTHLIA
jgi:hypothetical protein